jgi:porin
MAAGSIVLVLLGSMLLASAVWAQDPIGEPGRDAKKPDLLAQAQTGTDVNHTETLSDKSSGWSLKDIWTRDKLTGDWWGLRTYLGDHGIDIDLRLSQYGQWVASGGVDQNGEYGGTMDYRVNFDGKKLFGTWEGLSFNMHARTRFGQDVNADAGAFVLPNAGLLMPLPGDYHGTDITGLTVSQYLPFFRGRLANVFFGKLDDIDLVTSFFPQVGYGQEGFWNVNSLVTALPWFGAVQGLSMFGGGVMTINQEYEAIESGFLFTGTKNVSTSWDFSGSFEEGVWLAGWHRFFWKLGDKPGNFLVFVGGSTRNQASNDPNDIVVIPGQGIVDTERKKPWDIAAYVYQVFWQAQGNPDRKPTFFIGGTGGPDNPQFAQWNIFAAVEAFGLMASRPHDRMGVSGWYNGLSGNFKDLVSPVVDLRDTWGFELYYNIAINK